MDLVRLHKLIDKHFDGEELKTLCFYLGVDFDSLPALGKAGKARELVVHCERSGMVDELVMECCEIRSNVDWPTANINIIEKITTPNGEDGSKRQFRMFREKEIQQLFAYIQAGESACILSVKGVGSSNLINMMVSTQTQQMLLGDSSEDFILVRIRCQHLVDFSVRSIYSLMLMSLIVHPFLGEAQKEVEQFHEKLLDAGNDKLKMQTYFRLALNQIMKKPKRRLSFLIEAFVGVYTHAEELLFSSLRSLREDWKYRVSYIVFCSHLLPDHASMGEGHKQFYELLASNIMGLTTYSDDDAQELLQRLAYRNDWALVPEQIDILLTLTGSHASLLRATCAACQLDGITLSNSSDETITQLLAHPNIQATLKGIWDSLHTKEQQLIIQIMQNPVSKLADSTAQRTLEIKGILSVQKPGQYKLFSPLFAWFVQENLASDSSLL